MTQIGEYFGKLWSSVGFFCFVVGFFKLKFIFILWLRIKTHTQTAQVFPLTVFIIILIEGQQGCKVIADSCSGNCERHTPPQARTCWVIAMSHYLSSAQHSFMHPSIHPFIRHQWHLSFFSHEPFQSSIKEQTFDCLWVCRQINSMQPWYDTFLNVVTAETLFIPSRTLRDLYVQPFHLTQHNGEPFLLSL